MFLSKISSQSIEKNKSAAVDPKRWVDEYGDFLYRYALLRVRDPKVAQHLLEKTFVSGWETQVGIEGRVSEKGWLIGILRRHIVAHFQRMNRRQPFDLKVLLDGSEEEFFSDEGKRIELPGLWPSISAGRRQKSLVRALCKCMSEMPDHLAQVLILRELEGLETEKIGAIMGISEAGIRIMLYRARMCLRRYLDKECFGGEEK